MKETVKMDDSGDIDKTDIQFECNMLLNMQRKVSVNTLCLVENGYQVTLTC
jgi:hypothetical protein